MTETEIAMFDRPTKYSTNGATYLATVAGYAFYEHPRLGDEGCIMVAKGARLCKTDWVEVPTAEEIAS